MLSTIPKIIKNNHDQLEKTSISAFKHSILITLMEQITSHLCTFVLAEYRKSYLYDFKFEKFLNDHKKIESLGNYVSIIRDLNKLFKKENYPTIIPSLLDDKKYPELAEFINFFELIKKSMIEKGYFEASISNTMNNSLSVFEFIDKYTAFRNKIAHPLENNKAIFPVNDEKYYIFFTPYLEKAYTILVKHFDQIWSYKNYIISEIDEQHIYLNSVDQENETIQIPIDTNFRTNQKVFLKNEEELLLSEWKELIIPAEKAREEIKLIEKQTLENLNEQNLTEYIVSFLEDGVISLEELNTLVTIAKTKLGIPKKEVKERIKIEAEKIGISDPFPETDQRFINLIDNALKNNQYNDFVLKLTGQQFGIDGPTYEKILQERLFVLQIDHTELENRKNQTYSNEEVLQLLKLQASQKWIYQIRLFNSLTKDSLYSTTSGNSEKFGTKEYWHKKSFQDINEYVEYQLKKLTIADDAHLWESKINNWNLGNISGYIWCSVYRNDLLAGRMLSLHFGISKEGNIMTGLLPDWKDFKNLEQPGLFKSTFSRRLMEFSSEYKIDLAKYPALKMWDGKNWKGRHTLVDLIDLYPWFFEYGYNMDEINFVATPKELEENPLCYSDYFGVIFNLFNGLFESIDREYRFQLDKTFTITKNEPIIREKLISLIPFLNQYGLAFTENDIQGSLQLGKIFLEFTETIKSFPIIFQVGFHQNYETNQLYFKIEISSGGDFEASYHQLFGSVLEQLSTKEYTGTKNYFIPYRLFLINEIEQINQYSPIELMGSFLQDFTIACAKQDLQFLDIKPYLPEIEKYQQSINESLDSILPSIKEIISNKIHPIRNWMRKFIYVDAVSSNKVTNHTLNWGIETNENQVNTGVIFNVENIQQGAEITSKILSFNKIHPQTSLNCTYNFEDAGVWLGDTIIPLLSASSYKKGFGVNKASIDDKKTSWCGNTTTNKEWIQIQFDKPTLVFSLKIQGAVDRSFYPKELKITNSFDGKNWIENRIIKLKNTENEEINLDQLITKFIRIEVIEFEKTPGLSLDVQIKPLKNVPMTLKWMTSLDDWTQLEPNVKQIPEKIKTLKEFFKGSIGI